MATLINKFEVHDELINLIDEAERQLILISPYIKLHPDYKKALLKKIDKHDLEIIIVFGKNPEDKTKSIGSADFDFFKQFPNVVIRYCERLHAKMYANDFNSLVTSMNLYKFSAEENIEFGILCKGSLLTNVAELANILTGNFFGNSLDGQIYEFMSTIIYKYSPRIFFEKRPLYEKSFLGKEYQGSKIIASNPQLFGSSKPIMTGFCIRTGKPITFDIKKPFSAEAFMRWNKYKNPDFPEKYCHFSGEKTQGETTFREPILNKNWKKAREVWKF